MKVVVKQIPRRRDKEPITESPARQGCSGPAGQRGDGTLDERVGTLRKPVVSSPSPADKAPLPHRPPDATLETQPTAA